MLRICSADAWAQQTRLADSGYKIGLIDAIRSLVDSKYVLHEEARAFAAELRARGATGAHDSCRTDADFAERVTTAGPLTRRADWSED